MTLSSLTGFSGVILSFNYLINRELIKWLAKYLRERQTLPGMLMAVNGYKKAAIEPNRPRRSTAINSLSLTALRACKIIICIGEEAIQLYY